MSVHVYSIVYNEEFMLPHFLKHYEKFADKIFIIDDHSTDKTAEIAKAHPKVTLLGYPFIGFNEGEFSYTLMNTAKENLSDWAVCVDADEFIFGLEDLGEPEILRTNGYMMIGTTGKLKDCKPIRMKTFDNPVVFNPKLNVTFGDGRHTMNTGPHPIKDSDLKLYHYKYPSREYYLQRSLDTYPRIMDAKDMAYRIKRGLAWYDRHI